MMRAKASIVGIGETAVGAVPGSSALSLMEDAACAALADAGLAAADVDGVLTSRSMVQPLHRVAAILAERLGVRPAFFATLEAGGATSVQLLIHAAMAVATGMARRVLCVAADNLRTGVSKDLAIRTMAENAHPDFEVPFGTFPAAAYAMIARAHMERYGTTREQLAAVAVAARRWAQKNPAAEMKAALSVADVIAAKPVAEPFGVADCSLVSDGGAAFVVSEGKGIPILGVGEGSTHEYITRMPDLTATAAVASGRRAFEMAGLAPRDVQVAEIYDSFTITPIVLLEDLGFCRKGHGGPFAAEGSLPMNTHGGLLSHAHPGKAGGVFHITEAVRQLRGQAGERQVPRAARAIVHGSGGMMSVHATAILGAQGT